MTAPLGTLLTVGLVACATLSCSRQDGQAPATSTYATELIAFVEHRVVPPGASAIVRDSGAVSGCSLARAWSYSTSWNRARYISWVKAQLTPTFDVTLDSPDRVMLSRYERGEAQTVVIEASQTSDSLHVRAKLCALPD